MFISKVAKYSKVLFDPVSYLSRKKHILILSHMRSRSTLLSHILGSNSEICGYKELHLPYTSRLSEIKMRVALSEVDHFKEATYLLDKVLHNGLAINQSAFEDDLKLILLLREPMGSIASMFKMHKKIHKNDNYWHLIDYYKDRLTYLGDFAKNNTGKYLFVDSDELVTSVQKQLGAVTKYLDLKQPLQPQYKQFAETGTAGSGDPSKNIKAGKVINTKKEEQDDFLDVEKKEELKDHFQSCRSILVENALA